MRHVDVVEAYVVAIVDRCRLVEAYPVPMVDPSCRRRPVSLGTGEILDHRLAAILDLLDHLDFVRELVDSRVPSIWSYVASHTIDVHDRSVSQVRNSMVFVDYLSKRRMHYNCHDVAGNRCQTLGMAEAIDCR